MKDTFAPSFIFRDIADVDQWRAEEGLAAWSSLAPGGGAPRRKPRSSPTRYPRADRGEAPPRRHASRPRRAPTRPVTALPGASRGAPARADRGGAPPRAAAARSTPLPHPHPARRSQARPAELPHAAVDLDCLRMRRWS